MTDFLFALLFVGQADRTSRPEPWYERVLSQINPDDIEYGAVWEAWKQAFIDTYVANPYFQYSLWATGAVVFLLLLLYVQERSHERSIDIALRFLEDVERHDAYSRQVAREAIQRYNQRIEGCNRIIEATESGTSKLEELRQRHEKTVEELAVSDQKVESLETLLREQSQKIAELSTRTRTNKPQKRKPLPKRPSPPEHVQQINRLERELSAERQKNLRVKGTSLDVSDR